MLHVLTLPEQDRLQVQRNGRDKAASFADSEFEIRMKKIYKRFIPMESSEKIKSQWWNAFYAETNSSR